MAVELIPESKAEEEEITEPSPSLRPKYTPEDLKKPFIEVKCCNCTQMLLVPERYKDEQSICQDCDERFRAKFDKFRNIALARALRAHKYR